MEVPCIALSRSQNAGLHTVLTSLICDSYRWIKEKFTVEGLLGKLGVLHFCSFNTKPVIRFWYRSASLGSFVGSFVLPPTPHSRMANHPVFGVIATCFILKVELSGDLLCLVKLHASQLVPKP